VAKAPSSLRFCVVLQGNAHGAALILTPLIQKWARNSDGAVLNVIPCERVRDAGVYLEINASRDGSPITAYLNHQDVLAVLDFHEQSHPVFLSSW